MRKREEFLEELAEVKSDAARTAGLGHPQTLMLQAGANAPLIATALGSLLEVALDIRDLVQEVCVYAERMEHSLSDLWEWQGEALQSPVEESEEAEGEDVPVIEPGNEVDAEHLAKIFPPCPECGSERVNGEITDETDRKRKCEACGHEWELEEVVSSGEADD